MGWVWRDDDEPGDLRSSSPSSRGGAISEYNNNNPNYSSSSGEVCSTRKTVRSQCKTEEVEPGKFIRKCEKTEEILRDCVGRPVEVLSSNKEYTEEDVSDQVIKGSFSSGRSDFGTPFNFPGLRSDIEDIERHFMGGLNRFFEAAEDMRNNMFDAFGEFYGENPSSSSSIRRGIPIEDHKGHNRVEASPKTKDSNSGDVDLSGLARDV